MQDSSGSRKWNDKAIMQAKYDITSQSYDELYGEEQRCKYRVASPFLAKAAKADKRTVLCDIGCGTLLLYEYLKSIMDEVTERITYYVGIDLSLGMLRVAASRRDALVDIVQADAEHLPLRGAACTLSVSFTVIDLVPSPRRFLAECCHATRGYCLVSSLKRAQRLRRANLRVGMYIGETEKDTLFAARCA